MKGVTLPTETVFVMEASPIKFGLGATDEIAYDARRLGLKRVLIVTDPHIGALGLPERIRALLDEEGVKADLYDGVEIEPTDRSMEEAAEDARQREFDGLIGVGGGSALDTCKAVNLLTTYPSPLLDYINKPVGRGVARPGPLKPMIAVPATPGSCAAGCRPGSTWRPGAAWRWGPTMRASGLGMPAPPSRAPSPPPPPGSCATTCRPATGRPTRWSRPACRSS